MNTNDFSAIVMSRFSYFNIVKCRNKWQWKRKERKKEREKLAKENPMQAKYERRTSKMYVRVYERLHSRYYVILNGFFKRKNNESLYTLDNSDTIIFAI